jgi:hypothetical protein
VPTDVQFIRQNDLEIRFADRWASRTIWSAIGAGAFWVVGSQSGSTVAGWLPYAFAVIFAVFALQGMLWRDTLVLGLRTRKWTRRRGFWPRQRRETGSFDDLQELALEIEIRSGNSGTNPVWIIRLGGKGGALSIALFEFLDEQRAYEWFSLLARQLRIDVADRTGDRERRLPWQAVDRPLFNRGANQAGRGTADAPPPPGSAIRVSGSPIESIILPLPGVLPAMIGALIIGGFCVVFGTMLWRNSPAVDESPSPVSVVVVSTLFWAIGAGIILLAIGETIAHDEIHDRGDRLAWGRRVFGRLRIRQAVDKGSVEEIIVKPVPVRRSFIRMGAAASPEKPTVTTHVFVRSPQGLLHLGEHLTAQEQEWLCRTLMAWCGRSRAAAHEMNST